MPVGRRRLISRHKPEHSFHRAQSPGCRTLRISYKTLVFSYSSRIGPSSKGRKLPYFRYSVWPGIVAPGGSSALLKRLLLVLRSIPVNRKCWRTARHICKKTATRRRSPAIAAPSPCTCLRFFECGPRALRQLPVPYLLRLGPDPSHCI